MQDTSGTFTNVLLPTPPALSAREPSRVGLEFHDLHLNCAPQSSVYVYQPGHHTASNTRSNPLRSHIINASRALTLRNSSVQIGRSHSTSVQALSVIIYAYTMATPLDARIPPPVWTLGMATAQWLLAGRPDYRRRPGPVRFLFAGTIGTLSAVLGIAAAAQFVSHKTTIHPGTPAHARIIVTDRVFGFTRNPMYLALTGMLVTNAAWLGSVRAIIPVAAQTAILTTFQILPEERALQEKFGRPYEEYRSRVPRWIGLPRRTRVR